ncbi:Adenosine deaminase-like protein, partial [Ophiophagus hannah]
MKRLQDNHQAQRGLRPRSGCRSHMMLPSWAMKHLQKTNQVQRAPRTLQLSSSSSCPSSSSSYLWVMKCLQDNHQAQRTLKVPQSFSSSSSLLLREHSGPRTPLPPPPPPICKPLSLLALMMFPSWVIKRLQDNHQAQRALSTPQSSSSFAPQTPLPPTTDDDPQSIQGPLMSTLSYLESPPLEEPLASRGLSPSQTDDKGVFATELSTEYQLVAETFQLSDEQIWALSSEAIDHVFAGGHTKMKLKERWRTRVSNLGHFKPGGLQLPEFPSQPSQDEAVQTQLADGRNTDL